MLFHRNAEELGAGAKAIDALGATAGQSTGVLPEKLQIDASILVEGCLQCCHQALEVAPICHCLSPLSGVMWP